VTLEASDRGYVSQRLLTLSKEFAGAKKPSIAAWKDFKQAEKAYRRAKYKARLAAPMRDPRDETRKFTSDDVSAWVETRQDVEALYGQMLVKEAVWLEMQQVIFDRKDELSALRAASYESRTERDLL